MMRDVKHLGIEQEPEPTFIEYLGSLGLFIFLAALAFLPFSREILDVFRGLL